MKRTEMVLNPDHDALGSFVPDDITEGSTVRLYTDPGGTYTWHNGKVIDSDGKVVLEPSGHKPPPEE